MIASSRPAWVAKTPSQEKKGRRSCPLCIDDLTSSQGRCLCFLFFCKCPGWNHKRQEQQVLTLRCVIEVCLWSAVGAHASSVQAEESLLCSAVEHCSCAVDCMQVDFFPVHCTRSKRRVVVWSAPPRFWVSHLPMWLGEAWEKAPLL